jgi:hypothetical protein
MRRIAAVLLIATSAWLLYQTREHLGGAASEQFVDRVMASLGDMNFLLPALGGALGLVGGLLVLFGGVGGAAISLIGGMVAAGFAVYAGKPFWTADSPIWLSEAAIGIVMLALAGIAAILGRR